MKRENLYLGGGWAKSSVVESSQGFKAQWEGQAGKIVDKAGMEQIIYSKGESLVVYPFSKSHQKLKDFKEENKYNLGTY